jgi:hypothetical protein
VTQCDAILTHLKAGHTLTPATALAQLGIYRLAARVKELRDRGVPVITDKHRTRGGAIVARYRL